MYRSIEAAPATASIGSAQRSLLALVRGFRKFITSNTRVRSVMQLAAVSISQFNARVLEYLQFVETSGEKLIVTEHGKPAFEIRPCCPGGSRALHTLRGAVVRYDCPVDPMTKDAWQASR
ncbi:type II toxin-antitoxin system Phd/YefM family antitoxin [Burkholderia dolosa]|uniref:type II toxin-antitoxin system Phd/YefM family antitoxin n=1 Tax=Burkholderia dolosa TaxID=152500 RepID=UPI001FC8A160|nr:type II toxin-antitoxin system Phd/YefM family antitoxin [Burkholderia dolosa]MDN7419658.1 type II toxin-antitoxin system Phd/YefM family antitoxin [Burkholderia dolosa]